MKKIKYSKKLFNFIKNVLFTTKEGKKRPNNALSISKSSSIHGKTKKENDKQENMRVEEVRCRVKNP